METLKVIDINPDGAKKLAQKLHRKKDEIEMVRKSYVMEKGEVSPDERAIVARVSTPDRDRDGEVVEPKGIDVTHFNANPVLLWAHNYAQPPIGRAMWTRADEKGLLAKFQFANTQFADEIYGLYRDGFLKTFSIGFIPLEFDTKEKVHKRISLLEVSAVPVPSNPNAKVEAMQKGLITCEQLKKDMGIEEVQEPIAQSEQKAEPLQEGDNKILDDKDNPSISDLYTAISSALNGPPQEVASSEPPKPWYAVQDVFPVDFPNGHCVFVEYLRGREDSPSYRQKYKYADGKVTMQGERVEVVVAYRKKDAGIIPKPDEAETKEAPDVQTLFDHLNERLDGIQQAMEALKPKPVPIVEPAQDEIVIDPPAQVIDIEPTPTTTPAPKAPHKSNELTMDEIEAAITSGVAKLDLNKVLPETIALALDKLRGRVR